MRLAIVALSLILLPLACAQDDRKPSPFPDKNAQREAAAKKRSAPSRRAPEESDAAADRIAPEGPVTGQACFFSPKRSGAGASDSADGELVAAHAAYPLGARVHVTNLANGKTVDVKIVDRLSDSRRIISVSEAAARRLGFYDAGVANVKVEAVEPSSAPERTRPPR